MRFFFLIPFLIFLLTSLNEIKPQDHLYVLSGKIQCIDRPVGQVSLFIQEVKKRAVTDSSGFFRFESLSKGTYTLHVWLVGYKKQIVKLELGKDLFINLQIKEDPLFFDPIVVTPGIIEISSTELSSSRLSSNEIISAPNFGKDLFRAVQSLPGISNTDWSSRPYIRGGNPDETALVIDQMEIYEPYHLEDADGPFSLLNTETIKSINIFRGGFSSYHSDKMSGIINVETINETDTVVAKASVDFLNASINVSKEINQHVTHFFGIRRGYLDLIAGKNSSVRPVYYDIWNKFNFNVNEKNLLVFNIIYSIDKFKFSDDLAYTRSESFNSERKSLYTWFNWKYSPNDHFYSRTLLGYQSLIKESNFAFESSYGNDNIDNRDIKVLTIKNQSFWKAFPHHLIGAGFEYNRFFSDYDFHEIRQIPSILENQIPMNDSIIVNSEFTGYSGAAFIDDVWRLSDRMNLELGLRLTKTSYIRSWLLAPRSSVSYSLTDQLSLKAAYGWYFQPDNYYRLKVYNGQSRPLSKAEQSRHYIGSLTFQKNSNFVELAGYYKDYVSLNDDYQYDFGQRIAGIGIIETPISITGGVSKGFEVFFRKLFRRSDVFSISYSFAISTITDSISTFSRKFDRRHRVSTNTTFLLPMGVRLTTLYRYNTGDPYTPNTIKVSGDSTTQNSKTYYVLGKRNSKRLPSFQSLDIKIEKKWKIRKMYLTTYLDVFNLFNHRNIRQYYWQVDRSGQKIQSFKLNGQKFFPRLFSAGFTIEMLI